MNVLEVDPEARIGKEGRASGIRQVEVDDDHRKERQERVPSPGTAAAVGVAWPDHAIVVLVPVGLQ